MVAGRVDHYEQTLVDHPGQLVAVFAVIVRFILGDDSVRVKEGHGGISEIETALRETRFALVVVPFELHGVKLVRRQAFGNTGRVPEIGQREREALRRLTGASTWLRSVSFRRRALSANGVLVRGGGLFARMAGSYRVASFCCRSRALSAIGFWSGAVVWSPPWRAPTGWGAGLS